MINELSHQKVMSLLLLTSYEAQRAQRLVTDITGFFTPGNNGQVSW